LVELPLGDPDRDSLALYRSIGSGLPLINGNGGYSPPHYAPLAKALGAGDVTVLRELAEHGSIFVMVDRSATVHAQIEAGLLQMNGVTSLAPSPEWATFVVPRTAIPHEAVGVRVPIKSARANRHPAGVGRIIGGRIDTAWSAEASQNGHEEVVIELD